MKILALIDKYLCLPEATQICARALMEELAARGNSVVVAALNDFDSAGEVDGVTVVEIAPYGPGRSNLRRANEGAGRKALRRLRSLPVWAECLASGRQWPEHFLSRRARRSVRSLCAAGGFDAVISFSWPFATHDVAGGLKAMMGDRVFWVAYEMDPFAMSSIMPRRWEARRRRHEERALGAADLIVMSDGILEGNRAGGHLAGYAGKTVSLNLPPANAPRRIAPRRGSREGGSMPAGGGARPVALVFAGSFYPGIRPPDPLLELLSNAAIDYRLDVFGRVDESRFRGYPDVLANCAFHGYVTSGEVYDRCLAGDVLVDVQNDIPNQVPSKLFMYMSTGKPIVSLYRAGCEVGIGYLEGYPNALAIEKSEVGEAGAVDAFRRFCSDPPAPLPDGELQALLEPFSTPAIVDKLLDAMRGRGLGA